MTTISSSTSALSSLISLSAKSNDGSGTGSANLDTAQQSSILKMIEGQDSSTNTGLSALLGTGSDTGTTTGTDLSAILDAIQAQTDSTAATASGSTDSTGTTSTATSEQQKAATLMQSVYQSQQSNLFTLLG